jgi:hypothetical protein
MSSPKAPPPPDFSGIARAQASCRCDVFQLQQQQMEWAKEAV